MSSIPHSARPAAREWPRALPALGLLLATILWLYRDTLAGMVAIWSRSDTFAHAFLVPPIVLWLVRRQRDALATYNPTPAPWTLLPMAAVGLVWLLGDLVASNAVTQTAFTALLVLTVPTLMGIRVARALLFPLSFLFFAVPLGEFVMPQLMQATAYFTILALRLSGVPVYQEGLQFIIPSGSWSVVEACSGVRYLIASFMVGTLFAYLNYRSRKRRLLFVGVSILVPIVANWIRAYMIVMLGHLSSNRLAAGADHLVYGWLFFGVVMMVLYLVGARWAETPDEPPAASGSLGAREQRWPSSGWAVALAAAVVAALPLVGLWAISQGEDSRRVELRLPAALLAGWRAQDEPIAGWKPVFVNPSAEDRQDYHAKSGNVGVYVAYYRQQNPLRKLVSSANVLVKSNDHTWHQIASGSHTLTDSGTPMQWRTALLQAGSASSSEPSERLVVWQMYWVAGRWTSSDAVAKLLGAWDRLLGRGDDAAVVLIYASGGPENVEPTLEAFARDNLDMIQAQLRAIRDTQ